MVDWPLVLGALAGFVPAIAILIASYQPYEGHFKDNILFLFFMGGLFAGMGVGLFECLLILPVCAGQAPSTPLALVLVPLGFPFLEQLLKLLVLNRRAHQGARPTTFYGGAFGLGFAAMLVLFASQRFVPLGRYQDLGLLLSAPGRYLELLAVGGALLLAHFATGVVVGDGVRSRDLKGALVRSTLLMVPVAFLVFEFEAGLLAGREAEGLVYLPLALAYSAALAWWAHAKLLPKALPPDAQRKRRRLLLRERRERAGP